jgi:hypothetical protein
MQALQERKATSVTLTVARDLVGWAVVGAVSKRTSKSNIHEM